MDNVKPDVSGAALMRNMGGSSSDMQLIILDCDGVLVDSEPVVCRTYWEMLRTANYADDLEIFMQRFSGVREERILALVTAETGCRPDFSANDMRARAYDALERYLPCGSAFSNLVKSANLPVCVASNSDTKRLNLCVERSGLKGCLGDRVFSADAVAQGKPAPDILFHAANFCGVKPEECLVVEDSASGVRAAQTFGARVVGFGYRRLTDDRTNELINLGAEKIINEPLEIIELLSC